MTYAIKPYDVVNQEIMVSLYDLFRRWAGEGLLPQFAYLTFTQPWPNPLDEHIAQVLGYKDARDMEMNHIAEETRRILNLLASDNGWTVYKMLLARMDGCTNTTG